MRNSASAMKRSSNEALLDAMMAHPILINRPIVVTSNGVRLCSHRRRCSTSSLRAQQGEFVKEDGERVHRRAGTPDRHGLSGALPTEPGRAGGSLQRR